MTTAASESVLHSDSNAQSRDVEIGSGEPGPAALNGGVTGVSVALVQNADVPKAEIQTAERVKLDDDDSRKCCCLL